LTFFHNYIIKNYMMHESERPMTEKLSERVERLEGADREIDRAIKQAFDHDWDYSADWDYWDPLKRKTVSRPVAKPYTASLDAAMSLVPEGMSWSVQSGGSAHVWKAGDFYADVSEYGEAATPAIALCAAALKSRGL
jgi:hypothetical protein